MIDWWGVLHNALWVTGLAIGLAALSMALYRAERAGVRLSAKLGEAGVQMTLCLGMVFFCVGLLFSGRWWWERAAWGLLAGLFGAQLAWAWWRGRADRAAPTRRGIAVAEARRRGSRAAECAGWALVLAGTLVIAAWAGVTGVQVVRHARSLEAHARSLEALVQGAADGVATEMLGAAGRDLAGMRHDLEAIEDSVGPLLPLGRVLGYLPRHGGDLVAASDLLDVAVGVASAGDRVFRALAPALEMEGASGLSLGERLLLVAAAAQPELRTARDELGAAVGARARIDAGRLSPRIARLLERLDRYLPTFETAVDGLLLVPEWLGAGEPHTYLILAQNSDELRPTGGFISGVGRLQVEGGRLAPLMFQDSYAVDNLEVPHDLTPPDFQRTLFGELWFFRDTNWDADFPTSARRALEVYARDQGVEADGVIAFDLTALHGLLDALGPLEVEGIDLPVTGDNFAQAIQAAWQSPPPIQDVQAAEWWRTRKNSFGAIAAAAMDRLTAMESVDLARLARALQQALAEKHLLVYLKEQRGADLLRRMGWDGALRAQTDASDFLLVSDSNVGFNKVDPNVERTITYRADLGAAAGPTVRLTLAYRNRSQTKLVFCVQEARYGQSYADMMNRCYWDYVRVYVPAGSRLLTGPDATPPAGSLAVRYGNTTGQAAVSPQLTEGEFLVWTAFFDLAPGQDRTLTFEYQLPVEVLDHGADGTVRYRLRVQKQPGTEAVPLQIDVVLPPGAVVVDATPADLRTEPRLSTDLRTDRELDIVYRIGGNP